MRYGERLGGQAIVRVALDRALDSATDLANALSQQVGRNGSTPSDVTLGGYSGRKVELSVPDDFDQSTCDGGDLKTWLAGDQLTATACSPDLRPDGHGGGKSAAFDLLDLWTG